MGVAQSLSYFIARSPQDGPSLLTTWVVMLLPARRGGDRDEELLLPMIFANDGE